MSSLVLDASILTRWATRAEVPFASRIEALLSDAGWTATAPPLLGIEVANALVIMDRRGALDAPFSDAWNAACSWLAGVYTDAPPPEALSAACGLAHRYRLCVYDACYLELALRRNLPLATLDRELRAAAAKAGVQVDF